MMKFSIIKRKKNILGLITNAQFISLLLFIALFSAIQFATGKLVEITMLLFCVSLFALIIYSMFDYEKLNAEIAGVFSLEKDQVQIGVVKILYPEIRSMMIETNFFKGQQRYPGASSFFGPWNYIGKNNFVHIKCIDNRTFNFEFQILSEIDLKKLNEQFAALLLDGKINIYSHSLHKVPKPVKQTPSFLLYVIKLVDAKIIGKEYSERVLKDRY